MDVRSPRDGRVLEELGKFDPLQEDEAKQIILKEDRIRYWLGVGAQTSDTVGNILKKHGITTEK
jgi:small subunit ribosomal protein S16